jgi:hypothetical protein
MSPLPCRPPVKGGVSAANGGLVLPLLSERLFNPGADALELLQYLGIGKADHPHIHCCERSGSLGVVRIAPIREVTIAVDFDDKAPARAVEIRDVRSERLLACELVRQVAEELEPQFSLCRRWIATQRARRCFKAQLVRDKAAIAHSRINAASDHRLTTHRKPTPRSPSAHAPLDRGAEKNR